MVLTLRFSERILFFGKALLKEVSRAREFFIPIAIRLGGAFGLFKSFPSG